MKQALNRLNLRHNWPLLVAGIILVASLLILQGTPYSFSNLIPFDIKEIIDYPDLLFRFGGFPITRVLILVLFALLALLGARTGAKSPKALTAITILIASASVCVGCTQGVIHVSGDETMLSHMQTLHHDTMTYQLTRVRNTDDSGLISDSFWIFRCISDEIHCLYVEHNGRKFNPVIGGDTPEPSAELVIDPATDALYLQIGNEKISIAK